jgi:hypothetical protein
MDIPKSLFGLNILPEDFVLIACGDIDADDGDATVLCLSGDIAPVILDREVDDDSSSWSPEADDSAAVADRSVAPPDGAFPIFCLGSKDIEDEDDYVEDMVQSNERERGEYLLQSIVSVSIVAAATCITYIEGHST